LGYFEAAYIDNRFFSTAKREIDFGLCNLRLLDKIPPVDGRLLGNDSHSFIFVYKQLAYATEQMRLKNE